MGVLECKIQRNGHACTTSNQPTTQPTDRPTQELEFHSANGAVQSMRLLLARPTDSPHPEPRIRLGGGGGGGGASAAAATGAAAAASNDDDDDDDDDDTPPRSTTSPLPSSALWGYGGKLTGSCDSRVPIYLSIHLCGSSLLKNTRFNNIADPPTTPQAPPPLASGLPSANASAAPDNDNNNNNSSSSSEPLAAALQPKLLRFGAEPAFAAFYAPPAPAHPLAYSAVVDSLDVLGRVYALLGSPRHAPVVVAHASLFEAVVRVDALVREGGREGGRGSPFVGDTSLSHALHTIYIHTPESSIDLTPHHHPHHHPHHTAPVNQSTTRLKGEAPRDQPAGQGADRAGDARGPAGARVAQGHVPGRRVGRRGQWWGQWWGWRRRGDGGVIDLNIFCMVLIKTLQRAGCRTQPQIDRGIKQNHVKTVSHDPAARSGFPSTLLSWLRVNFSFCLLLGCCTRSGALVEARQPHHLNVSVADDDEGTGVQRQAARRDGRGLWSIDRRSHASIAAFIESLHQFISNWSLLAGWA